MSLYGVKSKIRSFVLNHELTYKLWFYFCRAGSGSNRKLPNSKDHFYIDGYPRSGNTYIVIFLKKALPDLNFTSHKHSKTILKTTLRLNIPIFIIIRRPEEAISSNLYRKVKGKNQLPTQRLVDDLILSYTRYYQFAKNNLKDIYIITFKSCIEKEVTIAQKISEIVTGNSINKAKLERILIEHKSDMKSIEEWKKSQASSLPNEVRQRFKDEYMRMIKESTHFARAKTIYEELIVHEFTAAE